MRARKGRGFWLRVMVWWVCLTLVIVGLEGGAVWWVGIRTSGRNSASSAHWLVWRSDRSDRHSHFFYVAGGSRIGTRGEFGPIWADINIELPSIIWTSDDSLDSLVEGEIRSQYPGRLGPILRVRDVLGTIRKDNYPDAHVSAVDVACVLPIGMYVHGESNFWGYPQHSVPSRIRAAYPLMLVLEPRVTRVLLHRAAILIAASVSALLVGAGLVFGRVRRSRRVRQGRCAACGYSLLGIDGAVCPECGEYT